jgi:hypothetical protein
MPDIIARPPRWALEAGLPKNRKGERLRDYCRRIEVDYEPLVEGIKDPRALEVANLRLSHTLRLACPKVYLDFVRSLVP